MVSQGAGVSPLDVFGSQLGDTIDGLLRYAVTLTGNSSDAEDLVMETVVRA
jgi:DNA-directed RNA polymerase specialized sigma24 family protein